MIATLLGAVIAITGAWSRPAVDTGVVYATIRNDSARAQVLVGASSPRARAVELHESMAMPMQGGTMQGMPADAMGMKPVGRIAIPAHGSLVLKPGGYHLMLLGLRSPLRRGERVPIVLRFADGSTAALRATIEDRAL
ncbi:MAG TPA: copper chaperone PCu(A)C [Candidatus Acidoferrum sp.]|nr:copper chaperone PCu(A)C [Candidatus Acidoferrum sp.]